MTEQEMNMKVAAVEGFIAAENQPRGGSVVMLLIPECVADEGVEFDWCNNPDDWGRLVEDNKIDIAHQDNGLVFAGAGKCGGDFYAHEATDEKIGVAVVKCFLMMNGVEL